MQPIARTVEASHAACKYITFDEILDVAHATT